MLDDGRRGVDLDGDGLLHRQQRHSVTPATAAALRLDVGRVGAGHRRRRVGQPLLPVNDVGFNVNSV